MTLELSDLNEKLEKALQKEKEIEVDLPVDRLIIFIETVLIGSLAIATGIFVIIGPVINCNPLKEASNDAKAAFTDSFCWFSTSTANKNCPISNTSFKSPEFLKSHEAVKCLYKWFPYILIAQIITFLLPLTYWRFKVSSRLTGALAYMQHYLEKLLESSKEVKDDEKENTWFKDKEVKPLDRESKVFDRNEVFKMNEYLESFVQPVEERNDFDISVCVEERKNCLGKKTVFISDNRAIDVGPGLRWLVGPMRDRHLFSIFCYHNFVSLKEFAHLLSVVKAFDSIEIRSKKEIQSINGRILLHWCHSGNFSNIYLTKVYFLRQIFTALIALVYLGIMAFWYFLVLRESEITSAQLFWCYLGYEQDCVLCWIHRKREVFMFYWIDYTLLCIILFLSLRQWWLKRNSINFWVSHFFEKIYLITNVLESLKKKENNVVLGKDVPTHKNAFLFNISGDDWTDAATRLKEFVTEVFLHAEN